MAYGAMYFSFGNIDVITRHNIEDLLLVVRTNQHAVVALDPVLAHIAVDVVMALVSHVRA